MANISVPPGYEICPSCGGDGSHDAGQWGEVGHRHSCYTCAETGYVTEAAYRQLTTQPSFYPEPRRFEE